jgi:choline dehydrogenase-like flavoprotein
LLLASANARFPTGIGNQHDNVGRYYMTHITGTYAQLDPYDRNKVIFDYEKDSQGIYCRRRWWIPEQVQEDRELLNTIFYLSYPKNPEEERNTLSSMLHGAAKHISELTGIRSLLRKEVQQKGRIPLGWEPLYNLGLPALLPSRKSKYWGLFFSAEQVPNRESRIRLSNTQQDAHGMPRVEVQIAFKESDVESLVRVHNLFAQRFRERNLGTILYSEEGFREYLDNRFKNFNSYAHHLGTTRMSDDPETGVVDRNAQVYGVENLFIAGSSTFPTGGHANPTVTVVAQALRLADQLKVILKRKNEALLYR